MYAKTTIHVVFILTFFTHAVHINMSILTVCNLYTIIPFFFMQTRHFSHLFWKKTYKV